MRHVFAIAVILVLACATAGAGPVLTITTPDIQAVAPNGSASWSFHLTNDLNYILVTDAAFNGDSPIGTFDPVIPYLGLDPLGAGSSWDGIFGTYTLLSAIAGAHSSGTMTIYYDVYSDPQGFNQIGSDSLTTEALAGITAVAAVPEPASVALVMAGLGGLLWLGRLRRR